MTKVTFENTTLADVIRRAGQVAPTRGGAFDTAAGIIMKIDPSNKQVIVMATDLSLFYTEAVSLLEVTGPAVTWRIPSMIFTSLVSKLPLGSGATTTMDDELEEKRIQIKSRRTVGKLNLLDPNQYVLWEPFYADDLVPFSDLGERIKQITWANTGREVNLDGVGFGPDFIGCTDRYRGAIVKMDTGMDERFVVPSKVLGSIIPAQGEVRIGLDDTSFMVMPNEYTQIRCTVIKPYVDLNRILGGEYEFTSTFNRNDAVQMINQSLDFKGGDRLSKVAAIIGRGEFAITLDNPELGMFGSVIEIEGDAANHKRIKIYFNPDNLRAALSGFPSNNVTMKYNTPVKDELSPGRTKPGKIYFTDNEGYHGLIAPMQESPKSEEES